MKKKPMIIIVIVFMLLFLFRSSWLGYLGHALVVNDADARADVAVVLTTGVGYVPRLLQAARLYREQRVDRILINGNRKSDVYKRQQQQGFEQACSWDENFLRILEIHGVPREKVWSVSAEDVFDTVSEAQTLKPLLIEKGINSLVITTSKYHTRRARYVWRKVLGTKKDIYTSAAIEDSFDPKTWWQHGQQVKQVMGEYGGMAYYLWKKPWR